MPLGFGKCRLCVQAPIGQYTDPAQLAGKRIVTSFPSITKQFFDKLDTPEKLTSIKCVVSLRKDRILEYSVNYSLSAVSYFTI